MNNWKWQSHSALLHHTLLTTCISKYNVSWRSSNINKSQNASLPCLIRRHYSPIFDLKFCISLMHVEQSLSARIKIKLLFLSKAKRQSSGFVSDILVENYRNHHGSDLQKTDNVLLFIWTYPHALYSSTRTIITIINTAFLKTKILSKTKTIILDISAQQLLKWQSIKFSAYTSNTYPSM